MKIDCEATPRYVRDSPVPRTCRFCVDGALFVSTQQIHTISFVHLTIFLALFLVVLQNQHVIQCLNKAGVQSTMLTGDSLWTGIHVARECGLIPKTAHKTSKTSTVPLWIGQLDEEGYVAWKDEQGNPCPDPMVLINNNNDNDNNGTETSHLDRRHTHTDFVLAMTGDAWQELLVTSPLDAVAALLPYLRVVGRCAPHDKVSVIDVAASSSAHCKTLMVGDGGNDCGALKAAHVGLALSDSDASIVAPFTSLDKDVASVLTVLQEGRASLASMMAVYKFIVFYGNISSYCQVIMYRLQASFSGWMWLFIDGFYTICFSLTLPLAKPSDTLSATRPTSSLLSWATVGSVGGIVMINYAFMVVAFFVLNAQDWYACRQWNADGIMVGSILSASDNYEISVTFLMVATQMLAAAAAMNFGYEFRQAWYRNTVFVLFLGGFAVLVVYAVLVPGPLSCVWRINCTNEYIHRGVTDPEPLPIGNPFNTTLLPQEFRWKLLAIMAANFCAVMGYEYFIVNGLCRQYLGARRRRRHNLNGDDGEDMAANTTSTTLAGEESKLSSPPEQAVPERPRRVSRISAYSTGSIESNDW